MLAALGPEAFAKRPPELSVGVLVASDRAVRASPRCCSVCVPALRSSPRNPQVALREGGMRAVGSGTRGAHETALAVAQLVAGRRAAVDERARDQELRPRAAREARAFVGDHLLTDVAHVLPSGADTAASTARSSTTKLAGSTASRSPGSRERRLHEPRSVRRQLRSRRTSRKFAVEPDRVGADAATADRYVVSPCLLLDDGRSARSAAGLPTTPTDSTRRRCVVIDEVFAASHVRRRAGDRRQVMTIPGPSRATTRRSSASSRT